MPFAQQAGLYLISDRQVVGEPFVERWLAACNDGVIALQLRERDLDDAAYLKLAKQLAAKKPADVPLLLNRRAHLVKDVAAQGVHVGVEALGELDSLRKSLPNSSIIGMSCHHWSEVDRAVHAGIDYVLIGPCFPTPSKPDASQFIALEDIAAYQKTTSVPILPLGGIRQAHLQELETHQLKQFASIRLPFIKRP